MNLSSQSLPRISIVTACLNAEEFLEDAVLSVIDQGYPNLEYIVIDGGSIDRSPQIIQRYSDRISRVLIESVDEGFYQSLNKGFSLATGEILGWLNADDLLHRRSLFTVGEVFSSFQDVEWITGIPTNIDVNGRFFESHLRSSWDAQALLDLRNGNPQQESTFWRKSLWDRAGGCLDTRYKYAADYDLWCRFMKYSDLVSVRAYLGGFRKHSHNMSSLCSAGYETERVLIRDARTADFPRRKFFSFWRAWLGFRTYRCVWYNHRESGFRMKRRTVCTPR